uniref:Uncharacterized protein n=1 Tax=Anopheles atroparvus TaxID=41427 RepID=A0AAG5D5T0_ANOAO
MRIATGATSGFCWACGRPKVPGWIRRCWRKSDECCYRRSDASRPALPIRTEPSTFTWVCRCNRATSPSCSTGRDFSNAPSSKRKLHWEKTHRKSQTVTGLLCFRDSDYPFCAPQSLVKRTQWRNLIECRIRKKGCPEGIDRWSQVQNKFRRLIKQSSHTKNKETHLHTYLNNRKRLGPPN